MSSYVENRINLQASFQHIRQTTLCQTSWHIKAHLHIFRHFIDAAKSLSADRNIEREVTIPMTIPPEYDTTSIRLSSLSTLWDIFQTSFLPVTAEAPRHKSWRYSALRPSEFTSYVIRRQSRNEAWQIDDRSANPSVIVTRDRRQSQLLLIILLLSNKPIWLSVRQVLIYCAILTP